ncbi:protein GVQW3 [Nilaparvata lugens]|uniref:protein GVQW3-like n=1 Tax=Nilaparvata lugens TaxID=108931 RepID=UPI000B983F61|nr:protein GVQW3-like [Nilaparvata lugens]XP_039300958.1 protein GVQW3 [Nilaparvata lugens]
MDEVKEQKINIKFCHRLGKSSEETYEMLRLAYGEDVISKEKAHEYFMRLENGIVEERGRGRWSTGGRSTENVDKVMKLIQEDRRTKVKDICKAVGISYNTCRRILLEDLNLRQVNGQWIDAVMGHCVDM